MNCVIDLLEMALVIADRGRPLVDHTGAMCVWLARQIEDYGGPSGSLEEQLRTLIASHEAMSKAEEEMPSAVDIERQCIHVVGLRGNLVRDMMRPIIARLRKERDDAREQYEREFKAHGHTNVLYGEALIARDAARAERAMMLKPIEPGQDMVEALRQVFVDAQSNAAADPRLDPEDGPAFSRALDLAGIRTVVVALAEMGVEAISPGLPAIADALKRPSWPTEYGAVDAVERLFMARTAPILAAKDARIAELEADAMRVAAEAREIARRMNAERAKETEELLGLRAGIAELEAQRAVAEKLGAAWRELQEREIPCGHKVEDLIGGKDAVTKCGACLAERKAKDEPITDPAERARAVALELRRRGISAQDSRNDISDQTIVSVMGYEDPRSHHGKLGFKWRENLYRVREGRLAELTSPRAIADEIQREEAKRAQAWAGDE